MRVGIYARTSTEDQNTDRQLEDSRQYCKARDLEIFQEYVDVGYSGADDSRPALARLMDDARKRKIDMVLVWRFDRFARIASRLIIALEEFKHLGIQFISYNESIDTSTPMGAAMFTMISAMAQLERDIIRERVIAGIQNAKAKGKHCGRKRTVDVKAIKALRAQGMKIRQIATVLKCGKGAVERALKLA